jgi:transposase
VDTYLIIKCLIFNNNRLVSHRDLDILKLKNLCRFRQNLIKVRTKTKVQLVSCVDRLFPEFQYFFKSGMHINTSYTLLKTHSNPEDITKLHLTYLTNLLKKASHGHFNKDTATRFKSLAKISVGTTNNSTLSIQIEQSIAHIELLTDQINTLEKTIISIIESTNSHIMSIPGIGFLNGAMILGEIGDIHRFANSSKLLAFTGLDPSINQSGQFNARRAKMSKKGSKILRYALINAAFNVTLNNKTFKDYYDLKIAQGYTHYNALGHVAIN